MEVKLIEKVFKNTIQLQSLNIGDAFVWDGNLYLMIGNRMGQLSAVRLSTGDVSNLPKELEVIAPRKCQLVAEYEVYLDSEG